MTTIFRSAAVRGMAAQCIEIEARQEDERDCLTIVGLPDTACRESRERVRAAVHAAAHETIKGRIVVSLAPADERKEGSGFDLAIALAVLATLDKLAVARPAEELAAGIFVGELTLTGQLRAVRGTVAAAELARRQGRVLVLPRPSGALAALVPGVRLVAVDSLAEVLAILRGVRQPRPLPPAVDTGGAPDQGDGPAAGEGDDDFADVRGQPHAVRAALVAAAGGHDLLMLGPPGCGKSMIARRLPGILPPLDEEEYLEVARVRSTAEALCQLPSRRRPFRAPHHTTSPARLVGGGAPPRPGEVSLAHHGVLFLDELPEFARDAIDALREPMEVGSCTISRVSGSATFPCRFQLLAAMNPCPCGWYGDRHGRCQCTQQARLLYGGRVSGPIRDRIDLHVELAPVDSSSFEGRPGEATARLRQQVLAARRRQAERFAGRSPERQATNSTMAPAELKRHCRLDHAGRGLLADAMDRFGLTARGRTRALVVARTIADLAGEDSIRAEVLSEALLYRVVPQEPHGSATRVRMG